MNDVVIYARLSQDQQGTEAGVERQLNECRAYAQERGWNILHEYVDNDISATKGKRRPGFERLLWETKPPVAIVCWHTDRLVRLTRDLERVIDTGLIVHAKHAGHLDLATPAGRAVARTITAWASYEGEQKAERQKSAHVQRAKAGRPFWNRRPFGFNPDGTEQPEEAEALRYVYRQFLVNPNLTEQARWLNDKGFVTSAGGAWRGTGVRALLLGARNAGIATYHGKEVGKGNWEALIDEATYRAVVRKLEGRVSGGSRDGQGRRMYLMTGFAICGSPGCLRTVRVWWRGGIEHGYRVYGCPAGHASAVADWVDQRASALIVDRFARDTDTRTRITPGDVDGDTLRAQISELEGKGETYATMLAQDVMSADQFATVNKTNRDRIAALRKELSKIGLATALHGLLDVDDIGRHWDRLTAPQRYTVMTNYFEKIVILPRGRDRIRGMRSGDVEFWVLGEDIPRV